MKQKRKHCLRIGMWLLLLFAVWILLIKTVDVQIAGQTKKAVGFATLNLRFHELTGVNMTLYTITDWLGLVPVFVCLGFGMFGLVQLIQSRSLRKVDPDIILLGIYYTVVIAAYVLFEMIPINYRPILIDGRLEASYPSSTTLLVLSVMPTLWFQLDRRLKMENVKRGIGILTILFSCGMVLGRLLSGVHWLTDIVGAVLLSSGLFCLYRASVELTYKK